MASNGLPTRARVVVVGGGVIGCSVAYHLAHAGWTDTVLVERDELTSGTTWHAAGLIVTFGSTSHTSTELRRYTRDLYARLEAETGQSTGFKPVGFVELAADADRLEEYRRVAAFNRHLGVDVHEISPAEVASLFPLARTDDVLAGFHVPTDGRANPVDVTMALAKGARRLGVHIAQHTVVTDVVVRNGAVCGVRTDRGEIECEIVVNCTGMWARQLAQRSGITVPLQAAEHYYLITEEIDGLHPDLPVIEDPSCHGYYREEVGGLMVGLFEPECAPWNVGAVPGDFSFGSIGPDWDRMGPFVERALHRVPAAADAGVRTFFCGPESFTPDLAPIVGPVPEVRNYFVCAGLNSIGILTGGGLGRLLAQWIVDGRPDLDVTGIVPARLHDYQATPKYRASRTVEALGMVYQCHFPGRSMRSARGAKRSPVHDRLVDQGAYFRDVSGWEGADWFAGPDTVAEPGPLTWGRPAWFDHWADEHATVREGVGLMDMSFMAKFLVEGPDAATLVERVSANRVAHDVESGTITYTQWLDDWGFLQADLTVTKLAEDRFWIVASDTAHRHVLGWLRHHTGELRAHTSDVTGGWAQLNLQGPRSRAVLAELTSVDVSDAAFPYRHAATIDIGYAPVLCVRITYLGELGYELYVPTEHAAHVHEEILRVGAPMGVRPVGLKALASLRLEKGYRDYGHDIDNTDTVWEAGLGFAVEIDKPSGFIGRDAALAHREGELDRGGATRRLVSVLLTDSDRILHHAEVLRRDGVEIGYLRAGSYGHTLGGGIGLAMVETGGERLTQQWLDAGQWTVEIAGERHAARTSLRPFYDPSGARVRG